MFLDFHVLIVLIFTIRILLRDDFSPPARMAWFTVLLMLPYFGCIVYFLFGEIDLGKAADRQHKKVIAEIKAKASAFMGEPGNLNKLIKPFYRPAFAYAVSINGFYPVDGNQAELMPGGKETVERMIADIDAAENHVHVLYYIWLQDHTGTALAEALIRAAKRGVTCRAMADGLGSRDMVKSKLWQRMTDAGVHTAVALSFKHFFRTLVLSRIDLRNHRKITLIDCKITYCGSRNSADPEFRIKPKFAPWVDILLRVTGPVVAQNQLLFASDWIVTTGENLDHIVLSSNPVENGFPAQIMGDGPTDRFGATPQLFSTFIAGAREMVTLSTPYFVPDAMVLDTLCATAHRGVRVRLIFPEKNDSWIVAAASRSYYRKLLQAGCEIHEFRGGLLHAKTLTVDGQVTLMGSSNLDLRSFDLNYENNILLQDEGITKDVYERQMHYIGQSHPVTLDQVLAWPYHRRIWNNVIATIGPVL